MPQAELHGAPFVRLQHDPETGEIAISSRQESTAWTGNACMQLRLREPQRGLALARSSVDALRDSSQRVDGETFYRQTGNDYRGEFRAMKEAWNGGDQGAPNCY